MKLVLSVLVNRMRKSLRPEISDVQCGFVKDKGIRNAIFLLRTICERAIEHQNDLYMCFIDYSKAFDRVHHGLLFDMLQDLDIDWKDLRMMRNLY